MDPPRPPLAARASTPRARPPSGVDARGSPDGRRRPRTGTDVIGVPEGAAARADLRLESVMEGVLVTGTVRGAATGECVRCLDPVERQPVERLPGAVRLRRAAPPEATSEEDEVARARGRPARPRARAAGRGGARPAVPAGVPGGLPGSVLRVRSAAGGRPRPPRTRRSTRGGRRCKAGADASTDHAEHHDREEN